MALGKHLFSFRTQQLSPAAAIILLCGKLARCRIFNKTSRNGGLFVNSVFYFRLFQQNIVDLVDRRLWEAVERINAAERREAHASVAWGSDSSMHRPDRSLGRGFVHSGVVKC